MDHHAVYFENIIQPHGKIYAVMVGRYQEGFLRDGLFKDIDAAFCRAVEEAHRLIQSIAVAA